MTLTVGGLFSGIGGLELGLERAGMRVAWQVEKDPFCRRVLEKHWPGVRRHDDVTTFPPRYGTDWRCDVICGGFPCQDISVAGAGAGLDGARSGLWSEYARVVRLVRPSYVVVENVAALLNRGMGRVLGDLASIGYDAEWSILSACALGAPHSRERLFLVAYPYEIRRGRSGLCFDAVNDVPPLSAHWQAQAPGQRWEDVERWLGAFVPPGDGGPDAGGAAGMDDGFSHRLDRNGALGNAVVPQVAEWVGRRIVEFHRSLEKGGAA